MKSRPSVSDFWMLIYNVMKIIGLGPLKLRGKIFHPPNMLDKLYPIVLVTIYAVTTITGTFMWAEDKENFCNTKIMRRIIKLYHFISFATPSCILVTFVLMHKEIVCVMNKLSTFDDELKNFGIEKNGEKLAKNVFAISLIANIFSVITCVLLTSMESAWSIVILIGHSIQEVIVANTILIFVNILVWVKQRFALLNETLYTECQAVRNVGSTSRGRIFVSAQVNDQDSIRKSFNRICKFKALHLELCDIINLTNCIFNVPILILSCQFLSTLVVSYYWINYAFINSNESCIAQLGTVLPYVLCPILRMLIVIFESFFIAHASRKVCMEGNATRNVLHKVWNVVETTESKYEFLMFSMQLLHNSLTVSAFGFIDLDYSYLYKILGAVLAYTIISVQLDDSE